MRTPGFGVYIVQSENKDLIIVFEDKRDVFGKDGYVGQIVSDLLMCHYSKQHSQHPEVTKPERVYCVRVHLHYVTLFAMKANGERIKAVCDDGVVPTPKIELLSDVADPTKEENGKGYDLMKKDEREHVFRVIATIRSSFLDRINSNNSGNK